MDTNDADEIGNLLVDLDGARGIFTGTLIDYRMPCTASEDTTCQIVSNLPVWNEFLCWIHLELRELPETGRQIGLVRVPDICFRSATEYHLHRAAVVLYWLLKTHRCVASVHIPSLKMVTIDVKDMEYAHLGGVVRELELSGSEEKVSFNAPCRIDTLALSDCKRCSELEAYVRINNEHEILPVFEQLPALSHLNTLSLRIEHWNSVICSLVAQYIATTSVLRKLHIQLHLESYPRESVEWFLALSQSLRLNRSITELGIGACDSPPDDVAVVGEAVRRSATIRKICILEWSAPALLSFMRGLSAGIVKNRTLCDTASDYDEWAYNVEGWFAVYDTARRNSGFVARSAQFLNHGRCDRHCAAGLDRVSRHPALLAELAEVLSIGQVEAADLVQRRFQRIEGLHDFMRLAGVVKGRVTCLPREDRRTQLDELTDDCWAHVRRYLELDDVPHSSASPSSP
ncbi:hypothetical protein HPB49_020139 [Dermacentor silvarum]|uniref:Uncharacterized protein n=1 Tax=Dermacentor silvarum TaxID=543639 RepID=A0ACB8CT05_DERSI|nr:hypothetical protein HPB49_020139 [Dermacentor silvarum]